MSTHSYISFAFFSSLHLLEVTFHLGVGKVETEGNREVKFPLNSVVVSEDETEPEEYLTPEVVLSHPD